MSGRSAWLSLGTALLVALPLVMASPTAIASPRASSGAVLAVGAESQYANVIAQIGGRFVRVSAVMSNPATDPHTYEASPGVAQEIAAAALVVQNGAGYDAFMESIEAASPSSTRKVVDVQTLLHRTGAIANPHFWYAPSTMPRVAAAIARDLAVLEPSHRATFRRNLRRFDRTLRPWRAVIATLRRRFGGAPVATTEPVADYLLKAAGMDDETPLALQSAVMNGVDPSPQALGFTQSLLAHRKVKAFIYNEQVTDTVTQSLLETARRAHVPVVAVYETMPEPGFDYQTWMTAEAKALVKALAHRTSTTKL